MTGLAGQCLLVLAVLDLAGVGPRRVPAAMQDGLLAAFAALLAVRSATWQDAFVAVLTAGSAALAARRSTPAPPARARVIAVVIAAAVLTVPLLALLPPSPGLDPLSTAAPAALAGLAACLAGRRADGGAVMLRAALFAALSEPGDPTGALPLATLLLAAEASGWPFHLPGVVHRTPFRVAAVAAALVYLLAAAALPGVPRTAGILGIAAVSVAIHLLAGQGRPGLLCASGLPVAAFGAAVGGMGVAGLSAGLTFAGLLLHAGGLLRVAGARPVLALLALLVTDASISLVRDAPSGLAVPAGLAAASWAGLLLLSPRPAGRAAADASVLHGGVALCAVGLGSVPGSYAGAVHMAGFFLAQADALLGRRPWPAALAMAGLPPSALFVSEFLMLRASGRWFWPLVAVLVLAACAFLRRPSRGVRDWRGWTPLAASAVLGAAAWAGAP